MKDYRGTYVNDINPLELLRGKADAKAQQEQKLRQAETERITSEFSGLADQLPGAIKKRGFVDCQLATWGDTEFAAYNLQYTDADYAHFGINVLLLFNEQAEHVYVANSRWRYAKYNGGRIVSDEELLELVREANRTNVQESIDRMAKTIKAAEEQE